MDKQRDLATPPYSSNNNPRCSDAISTGGGTGACDGNARSGTDFDAGRIIDAIGVTFGNTGCAPVSPVGNGSAAPASSFGSMTIGAYLSANFGASAGSGARGAVDDASSDAVGDDVARATAASAAAQAAGTSAAARARSSSPPRPASSRTGR